MFPARAYSIFLLVMAFAMPLSAQTLNVTEYPVPTPSSLPWAIASGPDGALWFTEYYGNKIGRITTAGSITEYPVSWASGGLSDIVAGSDGALWFTEFFGNEPSVGRITTSGALTQFRLPQQLRPPYAITAAPDGALWFGSENITAGSTYIGRITTAGVITPFPLPTPRTSVNGITVGPDGALWFTESGYREDNVTFNGVSKIGRATTSGAITEFVLPSTDSPPSGIVAGPDGALWFTETSAKGGVSRVGRITTSGVITEFPLQNPGANPSRITAGSDGALWFVERSGTKIGRVTTAGIITEFSLLPTSSSSAGITIGPDGALWFTYYLDNKIGRAQLPPPTVGPGIGTKVLPQFAFGGGWYSALYFTNTTNSAVSFPVNFIGDDGNPLALPSIGGPSTTVSMGPRGTKVIEAPNVGPLSQGYISMSPSAGVVGYGVFRQTVPGRDDQEAVVPFSGVAATTSTLTWDDVNLVTAVAIVNLSSAPITISVVVRDESGAVIGTSSVSLAAWSKSAMRLRDLPGLGSIVGKRGSADFVVSSGNLAALGLRFGGAAFTSVPTSDR